MRALVTGAASGIGRAAAERLNADSIAREGKGAALALVDINADALDKVGFTTGPPGDNLGITTEASIIRYHAGQEAQARLLARHLKSDVTFELSTTDGSGSTADPLTLITGTSVAGVLKQAKSAASVHGPSTTAPTTTVPSTSTTTVPGASTTTNPGEASTTSTVPGYLPGPPPPGVHCG